MSDFELRMRVDYPPAVAWARLWDLERHTAVIPLTTVTVDPPATTLAVDARFCGRTALGPIGFDDPMRVLVWEPPTTGGGRAVVAKTGSVIGGRIEVTFAPVARGGTRIAWRQRVELPWLPSPLSGLESFAAPLAAPGYRIILSRLLA